MQIKENFVVKNLTSYKIGGIVKKAFFPENQSELTQLLRELDDYILLGSCSNIIFSSSGFDGNVIFTTNLNGIDIRGCKVYADCGVKGPKLAQQTCGLGLSGFEFMIGFPGSVGGNICMNAGAHGQSISDCVISCCLFDKETKEIVYKKKEEMGFSYRNSLLHNNKFVLLYAEFELKKAQQEDIKNLLDRNLTFRKSIQPSLAQPNAGSVFKNPENDSAGRLLDKAGVKNFEFDNVKVWDNHANFIVNKGNATSQDVLELMVKMYQAVKDMYTIELVPEQIFIGNKTKQEEELCNILYKIKMPK